MVEHLPLDPHLLGVPIRKSGKPIEELQEKYGLESIISLSANENPLGPSPGAVDAIRQALNGVHLYPGTYDTVLRGRIAQLLGPGFDEDNVIIGNGSCDILRLVCQAFLHGDGESVICPATFPLYRIYTGMFGGDPVLVDARDYAYDLPSMARSIGERTRVVFVCNPNNPTGTMLTQQQIDDFLEQVPDRVVVVVDEAYRDYVIDEEYADVRKHIQRGRNVLIVRTFSKIHGLAGLRVGYGVANKELIEYLLHALSPYHVGGLNLIAAAASLDDEEHIRNSRDHNAEQKQFLYDQYDRLDIRFVPSQGNFILLVELGRDIQTVWESLVRHGVVVTPMAAFGVPGAIRVTIGTKTENERLVAALEEVLTELPKK
jgi:histidinol-phosphate aminotransferase